MKKCIPLLVLFLIGFSNKNYANHFAGAEITYKATATAGVVEVHLVVYQICEGTPFCTTGCGGACTQTLQINGADPGCVASNFGSVTVSLISVRDIKDNLAEGIKNNCTNMNCTTPGTFAPGIERYEFVGLANIGTTSGIPASCCNVRFSWTFSRSQRISTISGSFNNFYIDAIVNRCQYNIQPNSSPSYLYDPLLIQCGGQSMISNMGASYDPDGDSLSYAFAPALVAYNSYVSYITPFAYNKPLPWSGQDTAEFPLGIRCEPRTGIVSFTPGNASFNDFYGVLCVEIKQWKMVSGVPTLMGRTTRDMMVLITANCTPNNIPALLTYPSNAANPNVPKTDWIFPSGVQTCFTLAAKDTDYLPPTVIDTTRIDTSGSFAGLGGTFTRLSSPGAIRDSIKFCWTPTLVQQSSQPYILSVRVRDSRKPVDGKATYALRIIVPKPILIDAVTDSALNCTKKRFRCNLKPGSSTPFKIDWSVRKMIGTTTVLVDSIVNQNVLDYTFIDTGYFQVNAFAFESGLPGGLIIKSSDSVRIKAFALKVTGTDTTICKNTSIMLSAAVTGGTTPYSLIWTDNGNQYPGLTRLVAAGTINKTVTVKVTDSLNCTTTDTVSVNLFATPVLKIQKILDTIQCANTNAFKLFNNTVDSLFPGITYTWRLDNLNTFTTDTIQFSLGSVGVHTLKLISVTAKGCRDSAEQKLVLIATPKAAFVVDDTTKCRTGVFNCTNQSTNVNGAMSYQWNVETLMSIQTNATFSIVIPGMRTVRLIATGNSNGCRDTALRNIYVYTQPVVSNTINDTSQCMKGNSFVFTNTTVPDSSLSFRWTIDGDTSTAMVVNKSFALAGTKTVKLKMTSLFGCNDSLSKSVTVYASPVTPIVSGPITFTPDSTVNYSVVANPTLNYQWQINHGRFVSTNLDTNSVNVKWDSTSSQGRIFVSTKNAEGCNSDTTRYDVSIIGGVGLPSVNASFQNLAVFPNPTTDAITLSLSSIQAQHILVKLYNIVGTEIRTISYNAPKGALNEEINLHDLQKGIYFMRIEGEAGSQTVKILLK